MKKLLLFVSVLSLPLSAIAGGKNVSVIAGPPAPNPDGGVIFTGFDVREESWYSHLGLMQALNDDLSRSGFFGRIFGGYGEYNYNGGAAAAIDGSILDADAGIGYRWVTQDWTYGVYTGAHIRDRNHTPFDPGNDTEGTDVGARFSADVTGTTGALWWNAIGQFSTVDDAIWSRARVGYEFGIFKVGPEIIYLQDADFEEYRAGAFISAQLTRRVGASLSMGYAEFESMNGNAPTEDSIYGSFGLSVTF